MASKTVVGVDIGASAIKVAHLRETAAGFELLAFDSVLLPPDTLRDGVIRQPARLSQRLKDVFRLNRIAQRQVALAVSGPAVSVHRLRLPRLDGAEFEAALAFQARQHVPFDTTDAYVDGFPIAPVPDPDHMDVWLVAARRAAVDEWTAVAKAARLEPVVVDVGTFALFNAFELSGQGAATEPAVLLDVGAAKIHVQVVEAGAPVFLRDVASGGNALTEEVARHFGVPWEEAEHLKTTSDTTLSMSGVLREVQRISTRVSDTLADAVQQALVAHAGAAPVVVHLSGGAALQPGLVEALEQRLGLPVRLLDPFRTLAVDPKRFDAGLLRRMAPFAAVAVGLARRGVAEAGR